MSLGQPSTVDVAPTATQRERIARASALRELADDLRDTGAMFHDRGWSLGTSSNYSVVLDRDPLELLLTASGKDKGRLDRTDFVRVDAAGARVDHPEDRFPEANRPSAETLLHVALAERPGVGAVLHTHSVWGTLLSERHFAKGFLEIAGFEMLKGLAGITTHETTKQVPIFDNTQDIATLAGELRGRLDDSAAPLEHGFLIRKHGLYTWGKDVAEARRHIEIFEFLFECVGRLEFST